MSSRFWLSAPPARVPLDCERNEDDPRKSAGWPQRRPRFQRSGAAASVPIPVLGVMLPVLAQGGGALSEARSRRLGKGVRSWASGSSVTASQTVISPSASHGGVISAWAQGWSPSRGASRRGSGWAVRWAAHENQVRLKLQERPGLGVAIPTGLRSRHAGASYAPKNGCTVGWSSGARPCQASRQTKRMCSRSWSRRHGTQRTTCPASGECLV